MPELPEVEITARLLDSALRGAQIESALAPGINALKTFDPPLTALEGETITGVRRLGKNLILETDGPAHPLALLIHLMSAGRLQLYDKRAGPRDRTSRLLVRVRIEGGEEAELRLREFGSKQAAWVKLLRAGELDDDEALAKLGPEAWPDPGGRAQLKEALDVPRPLHPLLRDQRVIAGIGRSWVDEILWHARLSPFKRGVDLDADECECLREAMIETLGGAIAHYEQAIRLPIPDKLPMPLQVHRHEGEPCPRCSTTLRAVHFEDYVIAYCPVCQTEGRVLKDRRLSRLLK
jgi:formamidopyrimidine-DNA glycosylase